MQAELKLKRKDFNLLFQVVFSLIIKSDVELEKGALL